jgi:hypothetical protein
MTHPDPADGKRSSQRQQSQPGHLSGQDDPAYNPSPDRHHEPQGQLRSLGFKERLDSRAKTLDSRGQIG